MDFEAVSLLDIVLHFLIGYFFFRLAFFGTFGNFFQRYLPFLFAELNLYVDMSVGFFVGKNNQRLAPLVWGNISKGVTEAISKSLSGAGFFTRVAPSSFNVPVKSPKSRARVAGLQLIKIILSAPERAAALTTLRSIPFLGGSQTIILFLPQSVRNLYDFVLDRTADIEHFARQAVGFFKFVSTARSFFDDFHAV